MRRRATVLAIVSATAVLASFSARESAKAAEPPKTSYRLPFGPQPYLPSNASSEFTGFISPQQVPTAEYCGRCHETAYREWRESAHANSFREPFYIRNVELLINNKGIEYTRHCEACHNPTALFTGALSTGSTVDRHFDNDGVTCMTCHSIKKTEAVRGIGSYVMGMPAVMVAEDGTPVAGLPSNDDILHRPDLHKRAVMRDLYKTPEFCAGCHKAALPRSLNGYKWLRAFTVYDEWQQSSWSKQSPLPFYKKDSVSTCQTCHMKPVDAPSDMGAKHGKLASHSWASANTSIPLIYGYDKQLQRVVDYLNQDLLKVDIFALTRQNSEEPITPLDVSAFTISPGETVTVDVVIQNKNIGHSLVPEQRDFYQAWVEFTATDEAGHSLYRSGYLEPDGSLEKRSHTFTNQIISQDGAFLDQHQVWQIKARAYDNSIQSGRSELARYRFEIPMDLRGKIRLSASVQYRRFRPAFAQWALGKVFDQPTVELGRGSLTIAVGSNPAHVPAAADQKLRWNNYAIALLDQQQFQRSADAFRKVTVLDPKYVDGFINVAIADYSGGKYDSALLWLQKAKALDPQNLRAEFYQGMVYRWQYKFDPAIEKLLPVTAAYPRLRQARQELGYMYMLQHKYKQSREQYEALLAIDPDDLLAHRYLSTVYGALGLKEKARSEAALAADMKDDPAAAWLVQEYWRKNLNIAHEVVPYHVHSSKESDERQEALKVLQLSNPPSHIWMQR